MGLRSSVHRSPRPPFQTDVIVAATTPALEASMLRYGSLVAIGRLIESIRLGDLSWREQADALTDIELFPQLRFRKPRCHCSGYLIGLV